MTAVQRATLAGMAAGLFLAIIITAAMLATVLRPPYCPQEDSCRADYDGPSHTWIIEEVTP